MRLLLIVLAFLAGSAAAADVRMHRKQAGEPDKSGWMPAASTEGRFAVWLPIKFNDFTSEGDSGSPITRVFTVGARSSDKISFVASRIAYRRGAASAREYFARFEKGLGLGATPEKVAPLKLGRLQAVDLVVKRALDVSYQRVVLLDEDLMLLSVEAPREHDAVVEPVTRVFFDSLMVDATAAKAK